jgi:CO/xanthine dehydrogenase Mo-binding subunit
MPPAHIRVIATPNGGGFGGKSDPFNHEIVVCKAALLLDRPAKICLTREEVFYCHRGRHPVLMKFKTGVKKDGTITGMHLQTLIDGGAYGSYGVASTFYTGALQTTTYQIKRYHFQGCRTFTNKPPCGPKRGHGTVQPRFGQEIQLDKIAEKLAIDPAEYRLRIAQTSNAITANFFRLSTVNLSECIRRVVKSSNWKENFRKLPEGRGFGIACSAYLTGAGLPIYWNKMPHSGVQLKLDRGGGVTLFCGATEIGQGSHRPASGRPRQIHSRRCRIRKTRHPQRPPQVSEQTRLRFRRSRKRRQFSRSHLPRRSPLRHHRHSRFVHSAKISRSI